MRLCDTSVAVHAACCALSRHKMFIGWPERRIPVSRCVAHPRSSPGHVYTDCCAPFSLLARSAAAYKSLRVRRPKKAKLPPALRDEAPPELGTGGEGGRHVGAVVTAIALRQRLAAAFSKSQSRDYWV